MHAQNRALADAAATGIAVLGVAAMAATPLATTATQPSPMSRDVRLAAAEVPPGGLVTSFLGNQLIYCSLICPPLAQTGVAAVVTTVAAPATFVTAVQSGDLLKAIGATAASVTGPTNAAAAEAILRDGTEVAPRALNAFETAVVGLLNVAPAAAGGLPGIVDALQTARRDTFIALNRPIVPNPTPTVMPQGVVQVATIGAINVGAAAIFPAFNDVLGAAFETPNAAAQELAATGDPVRATAAGVKTAVGAATAATGVIAESVVTAARDVRAAAGRPGQGNLPARSEKPWTTTALTRTTASSPRRSGTTPKHAAVAGGGSALRDVASGVRHAVRSLVRSDPPGRHAAS